MSEYEEIRDAEFNRVYSRFLELMATGSFSGIKCPIEAMDIRFMAEALLELVNDETSHLFHEEKAENELLN